jgi:hypothetical protein
MNWTFLVTLYNAFQLRALNRKLDVLTAPAPWMPDVDLMPEAYWTGRVQGPPPEVPSNPCSVFITEEELERRIAAKAIERLENGTYAQTKAPPV